MVANEPEASPSPADGKLQRPAFLEGAAAMVPILTGVAPFALVAGLAGTHNGLTAVQTAAFSLLAYAGAAQIAALELIGNGAAAGVVIATALVINLRFVIYSATLAPHFVGAGLRRRSVGSYALVDHAVALSLPRFEKTSNRTERISYYFGACSVFWLTWQGCSFLGSLLGSMPSIGVLAFAMPLSFLGLLASHLKARPKVAAALVAGTIAVVGAQIPANLGMVLATGVGIAAGAAVGWREAGANGDA